MTKKNNNSNQEPTDAKGQTQPTIIYLTRHSRTTSNTMALIQGWSDFPLTEEGWELARCLGRGLKGIRFVAAYCANLTRHQNTARTALDESGNKDIPLRIDPDLREVNLGSFEGRDSDTFMTAAAKHIGYPSRDQAMAALGSKGYAKIQDAFFEMDAQNMLHTSLDASTRAESSNQVKKRMVQAMTKIGQKTEAEGGGEVLVISSGTSIPLFLEAIAPQANLLPDMGNTAVTRINYTNGHFTIVGPIGSMEYYNRGKEA